jgi:hypothetical protein
VECLSIGISQISLQGVSSVDTQLQEIRNVYAGRGGQRHTLKKSQSTRLCYEGAYKAYRKPKENWYPIVDPNLRKP